MRFEDDTPAREQDVEVYPCCPPQNLLRGSLLRPANLFAFEGLDASGKTTLVCRVAEMLKDKGFAVEAVKLGGSPAVRHAMPLALWRNANPITINLLNWVSLYEQINSLQSRLNTGAILLFDRYTLTIKVRGLMEGLDPQFLHGIEDGIPRPRVTFFLDSNPELCAARRTASGTPISYFESGVREVDEVGKDMREGSLDERSPSYPRNLAFRQHLDRMQRAYGALMETEPGVERVNNAGSVERTAQSVVASILRARDKRCLKE